ncbi:MAG: FAD:protein FMN transferase [Anaerolineae bacterium]|nr:FAD:protein FMN transferase [Anaerolineae bacterium]
MDWASHHFRAMGSEIGIWLDAPAAVAAPAFRRVEALFEEMEATLSRFRPESELMRLNGQRQQFVRVSPQLWAVADAALSVAAETGGLFDPTVLPALVAAGYDRDFSALDGRPSESGVEAQKRYPSLWRQVRRDRQRRALWLPAGAALDLGGIAKGYTASLAVRLLAEVGPSLVDAGGDITAGSAPRGLPGWPIAIAKPGPHADEDLVQLWLAEATVATSGIDYRHWQANGRQAHHVIDPRHGAPAQTDLLAVSVLAVDAVTAEGWATAALVAGRRTAYRLLSKRKLAAVLVARSGTVQITPAMEACLAEGAERRRQ